MNKLLNFYNYLVIRPHERLIITNSKIYNIANLCKINKIIAFGPSVLRRN